MISRLDLVSNIRRKGSFLCVGLDTDPLKLPKHLMGEPNPMFAFNRAIIDATATFCVAYKPNLAFYEAAGQQGMEALSLTIDYLRQNHPDQLIIADAKRGDIGNTAALYARAFFDEMDVDALTVAPYMGRDSVTPFLGHPGHWTILLALTSNPGSLDFQLTTDPSGTPLYQRVITQALTWSECPDEELMFVVGATRADMLADIRRIAPTSFLLVPGVGAQGGSLLDVARHGMLTNGECGLLVNSSRAIIYASSGTDFPEAAAKAASLLATEMATLL